MLRKGLSLLFASLFVALLFVAPASANVDNFQISKFRVDMELSRDQDKRSVLKTTETITAQFPNLDQNRGLERIMVREYDSHPTSFEVVSVTDEYDIPLDYHWQGDALRIGDPDRYVQGEQIYKITYTQRDVTKYYQDTGKQEFYWDIVGTEWRVARDNIQINLQIDKAIQDNIATDLQCYSGYSSQSQQCLRVDGKDGEYKIVHDRLQPYQGITTAIGFEPDTFSPYEQSLWDKFVNVLGIVQVVSLPFAALGLIVLTVITNRSKGRKSELKTIIPEYLPPKDVSVMSVAQIELYVTSVMPAQLVDLAVRHYIKLYQTKEKGLLTQAEYEIEIIKDLSKLKWEEKELLSDMYGKLPAKSERLNLKTLKNNTSYFNRTLNNDKDLRKLIRSEYGLREPDAWLLKFLNKFAIAVGVVAVLSLSIPLFLLSMMALLFKLTAWRLTDKGLELKQYLLGLKYYISVAEEERLKLMQSPEGAQQSKEISSAGKDVKSRVVLYEKLLPYAMLFGQEKKWNQNLGQYYEQAKTQPNWYRSNRAFSAAAFSSGMSNLGTAAASASSSSSSSGGSSGGGSSGGGGGGGGGGGW